MHAFLCSSSHSLKASYYTGQSPMNSYVFLKENLGGKCENSSRVGCESTYIWMQTTQTPEYFYDLGNLF